MTTELEAVKDELGKLKLDVAFLSAGKSRAEKDLEAINSKMCLSLRSVEALQRDTDEANEELVLVELARIEAIKEFKSILARKEKETKEFSAAVEKTKEKVKDSIQEIDRTEELEAALADTMADIYALQNELKSIHRNDKSSSGRRAGSGNDPSLILQEITGELASAKEDLNSVRKEGFQFMGCIDVTRDELKQAKEEALQVKRAQHKTDSVLQLLNSKLLRARAKLKEALLAEEKTKSVVSGMSCTLEQLKSESEAAKKNRELISEETASIRAGNLKLDKGIDLRGGDFEAAAEELEAVKLSEEIALENLRTVAGITVIERASSFASKRRSNPSITLSKFEYEYLKSRAGAADEVADEKAAAAEAWVEALKASEKEMLVRIEMGQREISDIMEREEMENNWLQKRQKSRKDSSFRVPLASPRKAMRDHGYSMTPARRTKLRVSSTSSPASQPMCYTVKKRRRAMPRLAKLFAKSNKQAAQAA